MVWWSLDNLEARNFREHELMDITWPKRSHDTLALTWSP
jgi:hypothetical protein